MRDRRSEKQSKNGRGAIESDTNSFLHQNNSSPHIHVTRTQSLCLYWKWCCFRICWSHIRISTAESNAFRSSALITESTLTQPHKQTMMPWCRLKLPVVDKVHRSSTWVKVQIRIIKYYSSKSKSTAFSILLEWKYKSTQFFMYLSKKVLIDRFILQFYIDYFI